MTNRVLTRREFLRLAAATSATAALAACAPAATPTAEPAAPAEAAPEPTSPPAAPSEEEKVVEFWGASSSPFEEAMLAKREEWLDSSGIAINYVRAPGGWPNQYERLNAAIAAGSVPDLAHLKDFNNWDYAWRGAVTPLDDYFAASDIDPGKFRGSVWESMQYEDTIYGAPWKGSFIWVLFTNDDLIEAAGLDPSNDFPTTWDELVQVAKQLTDESAGQFGFTFYELGTREINMMLFGVYVGQAGGRLFSDDKTKLTLDTPEGREALQWMYDMLWTEKVAIPPEQMESRWDLVYSGVVGTWTIGPWFIKSADANAPQLNFTLIPLPCHKTCDNADTPETVMIPKEVKNPDLSWQAIEILLDPAVDVELAAVEGFTPAYTENLDRLVDAAESHQDAWQTYTEISKGENLRPREWVPGYEEIVAAVTPELQAVWFDQKSVEEGLAAADKAGNEVLQRILEEGR